MAKYHLNRTTGKTSKCSASVRPCPFGGFESHFESEESSNRFYQIIDVPASLERPSLEEERAYVISANRFKELELSGDWRGLQDFVTERSNDPKYLKALKLREKLSKKLEDLSKSMEEVKRRSGLVDPEVSVPAELELRELTLQYRDIYEDLAYNNALMNEYRTLTARAAFAASTLRANSERAEGKFLEYTKKSLGNLEAMGSYPTNSPEWHAARAEGIGGSDVGAIMKVDPAYSSQNFLRVLAAKTEDPETLSDPKMDAARDDISSAIGRGNAWEEHIRYMVQDQNPELNVAFCKTSWHGKGDAAYRHANFDGLFLDDNGVPEGVLEIKTGSNPKKWGNPEDGLGAVPAGYRKQALWYAANADLKYGKIVAVIDDNDYREYNFSMSDPAVRKEVAEMYEATDKFWDNVKEKRAEKESGLSKTHKKINVFRSKESIDTIADVYSGYSGESKASAKRKLQKAIAEAQGKEKRELSSSEFQSTVFKVFSQHNPEDRKRPLVGIDIETSTASPRTGRIIETGIVELSKTGESTVVYGELHGVPHKAMVGIGAGATEIHGITPDRLEGKKGFEDPEVQATVLSKLKNSTMVAHNASYEDRWLSANLPGYIEAKAKGEIQILDTRKVAKYLMPRSKDNTLQSFSEDNGVPYVNAHTASQDAKLMCQALARLQKNVHTSQRFITRKPTDSVRESSERDAQSIDSNR